MMRILVPLFQAFIVTVLAQFMSMGMQFAAGGSSLFGISAAITWAMPFIVAFLIYRRIDKTIFIGGLSFIVTWFLVTFSAPIM